MIFLKSMDDFDIHILLVDLENKRISLFFSIFYNKHKHTFYEKWREKEKEK